MGGGSKKRVGLPFRLFETGSPSVAQGSLEFSGDFLHLPIWSFMIFFIDIFKNKYLLSNISQLELGFGLVESACLACMSPWVLSSAPQKEKCPQI